MVSLFPMGVGFHFCNYNFSFGEVKDRLLSQMWRQTGQAGAWLFMTNLAKTEPFFRKKNNKKNKRKRINIRLSSYPQIPSHVIQNVSIQQKAFLRRKTYHHFISHWPTVGSDRLPVDANDLSCPPTGRSALDKLSLQRSKDIEFHKKLQASHIVDVNSEGMRESYTLYYFSQFYVVFLFPN